MFRIRITASRMAWLKYQNATALLKTVALRRYARVVAYECRRNGTATYTPYWAA